MTVTGVRGASSVARMAFVSIAVLALGGCAGGLPDIHSISSLSPFGDTPAPAKPRADQPLNPADLIQPGALDDVAIGKANAPVTIVQYVSLNCATCGGFQREALPKLKKSYIDKGKARLIVREFPEDGASTTAALAVPLRSGEGLSEGDGKTSLAPKRLGWPRGEEGCALQSCEVRRRKTRQI